MLPVDGKHTITTKRVFSASEPTKIITDMECKKIKTDDDASNNKNMDLLKQNNKIVIKQ